MRHLAAYAKFLEASGLDWRSFPIRADKRVLVQFRGHLVKAMTDGRLAGSTASARMDAVIRFYRFAKAHHLVSTHANMWTERSVSIPFIDSTGFERSMSRITTDLHIPNRSRPGLTLEDGLLPLSSDAMTELLTLTSAETTRELHLMLALGFFTGARLGTVTSLGRRNVLSARPDALTPGFFQLPVGPGTGVHTKFNVRGDLLVPGQLLADLVAYAASTDRLMREARAKPADKDTLFLTRRSSPYCVGTVDRLVQELRKQAARRGLTFMTNFKFHQTRATYGTWMMQLMLGITTPDVAIDFVRRAMLHKHEATTFRYVRFIEMTKGKQAAARAFNEAFTGLRQRSWNDMPT